jgi:hypothetical protein
MYIDKTVHRLEEIPMLLSLKVMKQTEILILVSIKLCIWLSILLVGYQKVP